MDFVQIGDNSKKFKGKLPTQVELPIWHADPVPYAEVQIVKEGEPGWEDALKRWMFLSGWCLPEDNDREMSVKHIKGDAQGHEFHGNQWTGGGGGIEG